MEKDKYELHYTKDNTIYTINSETETFALKSYILLLRKLTSRKENISYIELVVNDKLKLSDKLTTI